MAQPANQLAALLEALQRIQNPLDDLARITSSPDGDGVPDLPFCARVARNDQLVALMKAISEKAAIVEEFYRCVEEYAQVLQRDRDEMMQ